MTLMMLTRSLLLLSLLAGAAVWYLDRFRGNYVINDIEYRIPEPYAGRATKLLPTWQEAARASGGFDPGGPFLFLHFSSEELKTAFPSYVVKYGERGFNTTFSVQAFEIKEHRSFSDYFAHYFSDQENLLKVEYLLDEGLFRYIHSSRKYQQFLGTISPSQENIEEAEQPLFFSCTDWAQEAAHDSCDFTIQRGNVGFSINLSYANLHLYQELQDYFFTKLESWRVK